MSTEQTCLCFPTTVWGMLTQLKSLCVVSGDDNDNSDWTKSRNWWKMHVCSSCKTTLTIFEANVRPPGECKYTEAILPWLLVSDCWHECTPAYTANPKEIWFNWHSGGNHYLKYAKANKLLYSWTKLQCSTIFLASETQRPLYCPVCYLLLEQVDFVRKQKSKHVCVSL